MREYRLSVIAVFLLLGIAGCCHDRHATLTIVGEPNGLTGINGRAGDVLQWTTLEPDGPGYTVQFPYGSPCPALSKINNSFHVAPGETKKCPVATAPGTQTASFTYSILLDDPSAMQSSGTKSGPPSSTGPRPFSAIPCRLCGNVGGPLGVTGAGAKTSIPPDATQISCDNSQVKVDPATVVLDGSGKQYVWWSGPDDWTVTFPPPPSTSPCTNGASSFSQAGPTRCVIVPPTTLPGNFTYTATLAGCTTPGTGILTVQSPTPPH
jgi:hypothetical protein